MVGNETMRSKIAGLIRSKLIEKTQTFWNVSFSPYAFKIFPEFYSENEENLVAVVEASPDESLFFTVKGFYYKERNDTPLFIQYDEIKSVTVNDHASAMKVETIRNKKIFIGNPLSSFRKKFELKNLLDEICKSVKNTGSSANFSAGSSTFSSGDYAGTVYGNVSASSTTYAYNKFSTPQGHGYAAERANHMRDVVFGHDARILGDNNALNGADRSVDGVMIQSKYCSNGARCISECFRNGEFRYYNADGSPMQIEVPSDKYDDAVKAMEGKIREGKIRGVRDPSKAKEIVRKGHYTYEQSKNIAKAGTIDSITFDATTGIITGAYAGGISAAISFAVSLWNGGDFDDALINAGLSFLKVGGTAAVTSLCVSQLSRTGLNSALVGTSDAIVAAMGPKASAYLVKAFSSGKNIYGAAAMKSASKLLRGNIITAAISTAVLSSFDIANIFMGRISGKQLFKNLTTTAASVGGATAGWAGGAAAGAAIGSAIPIVGTAVGGIIGGLLGAFGGGNVAGDAAKYMLDDFIEDDAEAMIRIVKSEFETLAGEYLVSKEEAERIADRLKDKIDGSTLKDMFASSSRYKFAENLLRPLFDEAVRKRRRISLPGNAELLSGVRRVLDGMEAA